jgi:hypothetical protein
VKRSMPAAVASRCCRRRFQQLAHASGTKTQRRAQADARGATNILGRGVQSVARGAARCLFLVLGRSAKTDDCGRSFAVLSTHVSTADLYLRHGRLACGIILESSFDVDSTFETARSASAFNFYALAVLKKTGIAPPPVSHHHRIPQFYVQRRSYVCRIPL